MAVPSPAIPTFTDNNVLTASQLNALGSNVSNLWNASNGGFRTQRDCVIVKQTTSQTANLTTDTLVTFQTAAVNTNNMWVSSQNTQITIQTAGIYWIFAQVRWGVVTGASLSNAFIPSILANGTNAVTNSIATNSTPMLNAGGGNTNQIGVLANLAAGTPVYLNLWHNASPNAATKTDFGGTYLGAVFLSN